MAKTVKKAKAKTAKAKVVAKKKISPPRSGLQFCIDFAPFPDNTVLGPNFTLAGFAFAQNPGGPNMFVNITAGDKGLQFPDQGMRVKLPFPARSVTMRAGDFAGPFDVVARNGGGAQVAAQTVQFHNAYGNVALAGAYPIETLHFKGGHHEGILVRLCIRL